LRHRRHLRGRLPPARRGRRPGAGRAVHPHLVHDHALRGLRGRGRAAGPHQPDPRRDPHRPVQLRRRGRGERRQGGPRLHRQAGRGRVRPRLSRPHHPDDGADRQVHALQARLRTVRPRDLPRARLLPAAGRPVRRRGRAARHLRAGEADRCRQPGRRDHGADPGRGRLHRPGRGL
ncbi:hypothetical protein STAWA0001_0361, partial [Staphylococcus warneri L37603]